MSKFQCATLILFSLVVLGCGSSPGAPSQYPSSSSPTPTSPTSPDTPSSTNSGPLIADSDLNGNWLGTCGISYLSSSSLEQVNLGFDALGSLTFTVSTYSGGACSGTPDIQIVFNGTYSITGLTTGVSGASNVTLTLAQAQMTPESASAATALTAASTCTLTNWTSGTPQVIAVGAACLPIIPSDGVIAQITSGGVLYFGNSTNSAINTSSGYIKQ